MGQPKQQQPELQQLQEQQHQLEEPPPPPRCDSGGDGGGGGGGGCGAAAWVPPPLSAAALGSFAVGADRLAALHYVPDYVSREEEARLLREVAASRAKWVQLSGRRLQQHGGTVAGGGLVPAPMAGWLRDGLVARLGRELAPLFGGGGGGGGGGSSSSSAAAAGAGALNPNHVLINSYLPGCGIMPHEDGELYAPLVAIVSLGAPAVLRFWRKEKDQQRGFAADADGGGAGGGDGGDDDQQQQQQQPQHGEGAAAGAGTTTSTSGGVAGARGPPVASLLAQPRSLLLFSGDAYTRCLHGIEEASVEALDDSVVNRAAAGVPPWLRELPRGGERVSLTIRRVLKTHKALGRLLPGQKR